MQTALTFMPVAHFETVYRSPAPLPLRDELPRHDAPHHRRLHPRRRLPRLPAAIRQGGFNELNL